MAKLYTRLSWHPACPAPFESAWILFLKVCVLNEITPHNLMRLIQTDVSKKRKIKALNITDSSWIDFQKFSSLLEVSEERLRNCFPDQLGIGKPIAEYSVRICPQCLELNYHCVLFDLPFVQTCPWHGVPLIGSCKGCSEPIKGARLVNPYNLFLHCPICCEVLVDFISDFEVTRVPGHFADKIHVQCCALVDWWTGARKRYSPADELPPGYQAASFGIYYSVMLDVADRPPFPWNIEKKQSDFKVVRWGSENRPANLDLVKSYRSIRRHLFNTFVRPKYRECIQRVFSCNGYAVSFNVDEIPKPALAYLLWRMSIEGRGLSDLDQRSQTRLSLKVPNLERIGPPFDDFILNWLYTQYFGIYKKLLSLDESTYYYFYLGHIYASSNLVWLGKKGMTSQAILFPDINKFLDKERQRGSRGSAKFFFQNIVRPIVEDLPQFSKYEGLKPLVIVHNKLITDATSRGDFVQAIAL